MGVILVDWWFFGWVMQRSQIKFIVLFLFKPWLVFYAGMTFKQTLYEDWCMDNGGLIKQGVYDNCVFKKSPSKTFWVFYGVLDRYHFIRLVVFWLSYAKVSNKIYCVIFIQTLL
jgi:hypothetical protein